MNNVKLPTDYQSFIALSRYARWIDYENRREEWSETVERYLDFMTEQVSKNYNYKRYFMERYIQCYC